MTRTIFRYNGSFDDDDAEGFSTTSLPKVDNESLLDESVDLGMIVSPFLHRHPLLSMFHQKSPCKIHPHRPTTQPLQTQSHLTMNPAPTQMNPHPFPKKKALDTII
jgi:hypothetical protein